MNQNPVRTALIGCGNFARWQHLPNLLRLPEAQLMTLCDLDPAALSAAQTMAPAARACTAADQVFADPAIEAVVISVRDDLQADLTLQALAAGKHVYVEKPLAPEPEPIQRVITARTAAQRLVAVGFQKRFAPIYLQAKAIATAAGGLQHAVATMADDAWRWAHGYPPGYLLVHDLCHLFDLLRYLTGDEVCRVYAATGRPDDDAIVLSFTRGAVAMIGGSGQGSMDMPKERLDGICHRSGFSALDFVELRTFGLPAVPAVQYFAGHSVPGHGFLHRPLFAQQGLAGMLALRRIAWEARTRTPDPTDPYAAEERAFAAEVIPNFLRDQGWMSALRTFLQAIRGGTAAGLATPEDALAAAHIAEAALTSRATGRAITLNQESTHAQ
ncbi:MAG: Gfo/Idh/MocA family oxidoreductase [Phycisphaerae bacterium]